MKQETKRILLCLALIAVLATAWFKPLDPIATQQVDAGLKRALVSFATARALNSIRWTRNTDVGARVEKLKALASEMTEHFVMLIVVFLMQTLVLPLVLFWVLFRVGRAALDAPLRA